MVKKRFHNAVEVRKWLASAKPGDVVEYHRGPNALETSRTAREELVRRDELFLHQKKLGPLDFSYRVMVLTPELGKKLHGLSDEMCVA